MYFHLLYLLNEIITVDVIPKGPNSIHESPCQEHGKIFEFLDHDKNGLGLNRLV